MARGKKKEELTLEEKLERALVPVDEQPYEVPGNWCWTYLTHGFCECMDNFRKPINASERAKRKGDVPYYGATGQVGWIDDYLTDEQLVLIGEDGAPFFDTVKDKAYMIEGKAWVNNHAHILKSYYGEMGNKFIMNYLNSFNYKGYVNGTTRLKLTQANMNTIPVPLPPLEEQQRIVERIENLLTKLDEVKENLQNTLDEMKVRRMSILQKAFRGELTIQWRLDNNVDIDTWEEKQLHEVCKSIFDGDHMPPPKSESGIHFLVISNVNTGYLSFENTRYVPKEYYDNISVTRKPEKGDILYTLVGSYGIPIVVDSDTPFCFQRHMGLLKPNKIDTYFLWYQMQNQEFYNKVTEIANGTAQLTVPIKGLRKLKICCPSENEQKEIVCILNNLLRKENEMKQFVESVLYNVSLLKKTILTKAFRGELGTNKTDEESSIGLLKNILKTQVVM